MGEYMHAKARRLLDAARLSILVLALDHSSSSLTVRLRPFRAASSVDPLAKIRMARDAISSYRLGLTGVGLTGQRIKIVCGISLVATSSTVSLAAGVMWPSLRVMGEDWFTADLCSVEVPGSGCYANRDR